MSTVSAPAASSVLGQNFMSKRIAVTSRLAQTYRLAQPMAFNGRVVAAPRSTGEVELLSIGSGGAVFHWHPSADDDGAWVADNLDCPSPALDVAAIGNGDGSLTFYAIVARSRCRS